MIRFNAILRDVGLDPSTVRLVRHQDNRAERGCRIYDLWRAGDGRFENYQSLQAKPRFDAANYIASFVGTPMNETLFVGLYRVNGRGVAPDGMIDPAINKDVGGHHLYDMTKDEVLSEYEGRLVINWGDGARAWVQRAANQDKPVIEIRTKDHEPPFPGFVQFSATLNSLETLPLSWRTALAAVSGVYLLISFKNGKQYVGSAYGAGGFWTRWMAYAASGHGGNVEMKLDPHVQYQVAILEVAPSSATAGDIVAMEARWKDKLQTRQFGLNRN